MLSSFSLTGKTALITGSSRGIGLALARGLGEAGARVILNGRDEAKAREAASILTEGGIEAETSAFDVTNREETNLAVSALESARPIDILVNCAGMQHRAPLETFPEDRWRELMSTNLDSVFYVSQAVAQAMLARGAGKIVNVCSIQSELGRASIVPYAAAKGAVKMLTKGMCAEWGPRGLQINGLAPGYFVTELTRALKADPQFDAWLVARTPARRWGEVSELAGACVFLCSAAADYVNGHVLFVDGGLTSVV